MAGVKLADIDNSNSKTIIHPSSFTTMMAIFAILNSFDNSENKNASGAEINLIDAQIALSQLISADKEGSEEEPKLGLCDTARITLDIVNAAQRSRNYHDSCIAIADQAYQLVNAVDAGINGGAIDVNPVLRDHIVRLNADLDQIRQTIKRLGSWWIFPRMWGAESELERCHTILEQGMEMYILLLRFSLTQFERRESFVHHEAHNSPPANPSTMKAKEFLPNN